MKKTIVLVMGLITLVACNKEAPGADVELKANIDSVSYAIGSSQARGLLNQVPDLNVEAFIKGYLDVADSLEVKLSDAECQTILQTYSQKLQAEQLAKKNAEIEKQYAEVKESGIAFLEANKSKPGVKVTASGLQYVVVKEGTGKQPQGPTADVTVRYKGTTPEGVEFDSNDSTNFRLNQVIRGWTEALQLMKEGGVYTFYIPQELAYGANPRPGGPIKPFMPLVFEIELLKVN
ncbi:FKBP-type peptidyl-prolyl cis-trans isomerase N-terminal domain-containing protein [Spongiimicrobium salis]|uniref:FKBP-type peptidyl-prolyl cis-trans isomerase N-terminal domain-containing protein n=1 Tax=Spongiimicrobium salis TaxID=1667022 RepID=UPI00374D482A